MILSFLHAVFNIPPENFSLRQRTDPLRRTADFNNLSITFNPVSALCERDFLFPHSLNL